MESGKSPIGKGGGGAKAQGWQPTSDPIMSAAKIRRLRWSRRYAQQ